MPDLVVATLNLKCRVARYDRRWPLLVDALSRLRPDLVALQEDCCVEVHGQAAELAEALTARLSTEYHHAWAGTHEVKMSGHVFREGVSVLSRHRIERQRVLDLPSAMFARKAVVVDVTVDGRPLRFTSTHLDFGVENEPVRSADARLFLDDLPEDGEAILAGDLNATPETRAIGILHGGLVDLWTAAHPDEDGFTFPANAPDRRIDYLFATSTLARGLQDSWLIAENDGEVWLSDHLGLAARMTWD